MGGLGSGNFRPHMATVESCLCLELCQLIWLGAVQPGARRRGILHWPAGSSREYAATMAYVSDLRETPWLHLTYGVQHAEAAEQPIAQVQTSIALTTMPLHYGGVRWWFRCQQIREGEACAQRAQTLYLPLQAGARFGCTHCHRLTYASQQSRWPTWRKEWPAITVQDLDRVEARLVGAVRRRAEGKRGEPQAERS
jgi:hypothetical protein